MNGTHTPNHGKPPRLVYAAFEEGRLIGNMACHHCDKQGCQAELQSIHVYPEYQCKGIGAHLLLIAVDWLLQEGIGSMLVGFDEHNPYQRFYLKYGGIKAAPYRCEWHDLENLRSKLI